MNVLRLAFAYAVRRPLSTLLVVALLAIGVATVALTLIVARELEERLTRDAAGIDLVVGAKGSPLQLVLAGVYHADVPPGNVPLAAVTALRANPQVASAIPLSLGDSFRGYRIVGTEPAFVEHYGAAPREGRLWQGPMEAVLGNDVARATGLGVGAKFAGSHGLAEGGGEHAGAAYAVVGVLAPTGTVLDRLVVTSLESVWDVHEPHHAGSDGHDDEKREVTLALVRFATPLAASGLARAINKDTELVAASPAYETARLLTVFGVGFDLVRAFALILVVASGFMLFVALAQALEDRRYDLAILRTLGASRTQVGSVLLAESLALVVAGTALGLLLAHLGALALGTFLPQASPLAATAFQWRPEEWWVVGLALLAGILAALWPAWRAARLDVSATLADG